MGSKALIERCDKSVSLSAAVWDFTVGAVFPADPRDALALAASALAHEHHSSIVQLVRTGHYAGAATLLRPLIEACLSGTWLLYCATEDRARELQSGTDQFLPKPSRMWSECSKNLQVGEGVSQFHAMMAKEGVIFHKFTHGDIPQLERRFHNGERQVPFIEKENWATLLNAELFLLLSSDIAGVAYKYLAAKPRIGELMRELLLEFSKVLGTPFQWQEPWTGLPVPDRGAR